MDLTKRLLEKSKEAFLLAIELYNKPTIKYRVEGFSLFICNAWELMLKAHMIEKFGESSVYYKDNHDRTITLENCISKVFTNKKDPLRQNLEKIIELRNTSTHFITEEYEMVYVPLFQSCVFNFNDKMKLFHNIDMSETIPQNFLTLSVSMKALDDSTIIATYPEEIATKLLNVKKDIDEITGESNSKFAIRIEHHHLITKNREEATSFVKVDNKAETSVKIIKELKDPNNTHKHTGTTCIEKVNSILKSNNITLYHNGNPTKFNMHHFLNFCKHYGLKSNEKFCYAHRQFAQPRYTYSQQTIDFIVEELAKDPAHILDNIKK